ncbi:cytochrome c biogenesis protein ResB [bacterium]|nr:cytochrome c biogenesis protein ResB [bacterium]
MDRIQKFFSSTKIAIALLIILTLSSIIGTIIPQNGEEQAYIHKYGESLYYVFNLLSITDLYHSWWFVGILGLLSINVIVCSLNRLPSIISPPKKEIDAQYILSLPLNGNSLYPVDIVDARNSLTERLNKQNYHLSVISQKPTEIILFAEKGRLGRLGSFITHLSILIILSGGVIGGLFGFKEYLAINEKEAVNVPHTDFRLRLDDFNVEYYPASKMPKDYKSTLTIINGGKDVLTKTIEVNHPLVYKGVWFYQASYGVGEIKGVTINVAKRDNDKGQDFTVKTGESVTIWQTNLSFEVAQFLPDFTMEGTKTYSKSEELNNPAAKLNVSREGKFIFSQWVFYNFPDFHPPKVDTGLKFKLVGFDASQYTGLQIVKDPGVPVVWTGCGLLMIGLILSFFVFHRRLWVYLQKKGKETTVLIGGMTNKNKFDFEQEFRELVIRKLYSK